MEKDKVYTAEEIAVFRLAMIDGFSAKAVKKMIKSAGSACGVFETSMKKWEAMLKPPAFERFKKAPSEAAAARMLDEIAFSGIKYISCMDEEYPSRLNQLPGAPAALYVNGSLPDDRLPSAAIIGARMCSEYGRYMARQFGSALGAAGIQVVSGMALGVDGISQKGAIDAGGTSFGVLGCGVDICYPEENRALYDSLATNGGIISELRPKTMPKACFFPMRNRLISALSDCVIVIEARKKSGTLITVDFALAQGRDVYAIPGRATDRLSDGCNELIKQGAFPVTDPEEVIERLLSCHSPSNGKKKRGRGIKKTAKKKAAVLSAEEEALMDVLDIHLKSASDISDTLQKNGVPFSVPSIMNTLVQMALKGLCVQEGTYFRLEAGS